MHARLSGLDSSCGCENEQWSDGAQGFGAGRMVIMDSEGAENVLLRIVAMELS